MSMDHFDSSFSSVASASSSTLIVSPHPSKGLKESDPPTGDTETTRTSNDPHNSTSRRTRTHTNEWQRVYRASPQSPPSPDEETRSSVPRRARSDSFDSNKTKEGSRAKMLAQTHEAL